MSARRFFFVYCIVAIPVLIYASVLCGNNLKISHKIESLIKINYPKCKLLQMTDLNQDLQDYFVHNFPNSSPGYVASDFNGDGKLDYAALLICLEKKKSTIRFVVFMARKDDSYSCLKIHKWSEKLYLSNLYLNIVKPGKIQEWDSERIITIEHPGIALVLFEAASRVYYWKRGQFNYIQTSD